VNKKYNTAMGSDPSAAKKDLVFYKVNEHEKIVTVYAVVDQRQDYLNIIRGL